MVSITKRLKKNPVNVPANTYINYSVDYNVKKLKFKVGDHIRISKYKNAFARGYTANWFEEVFSF